MKARLATINLQVADPQRSKRFYLDLLGMVEDPRRSHPPSFVYMTSEGCDVTIATPEEAHGSHPSRTMELGFEVDDIAAMTSHLAASGHRDFRRESMGWGEALTLSDTDGHRVVIYSFQGAGGRPPGQASPD